MTKTKTHREIKNPQMSARYLADYMAASETTKRTIVRNCKYQPIARVIQHDEAKSIIAKYLTDAMGNTAFLASRVQELRGRLADDDFYRSLFDHNAAYVEHFLSKVADLDIPSADILLPGKPPAIVLEGLKVTVDIRARFRRLTKTNKVKVGALAMRYSKGKPLPLTVAEWQSAFIYGYLTATGIEDGAEVEQALCLTLDSHEGKFHPAPSDAISRFKNMRAACASIVERWQNVKPPPGAIL